jgi:hypothetical protein
MADFAIEPLNGGEVAISALTEAAQNWLRLKGGLRLACKSYADARPLLETIKAEGFTVAGEAAAA